MVGRRGSVQLVVGLARGQRPRGSCDWHRIQISGAYCRRRRRRRCRRHRR